jgi:hypothetical protein
MKPIGKHDPTVDFKGGLDRQVVVELTNSQEFIPETFTSVVFQALGVQWRCYPLVI